MTDPGVPARLIDILTHEFPELRGVEAHGMPDLTLCVPRLKPGTLTVAFSIGPGPWHSALAYQVALRVMRKSGNRAVWFSVESSPSELALKILAAETGVGVKDLTEKLTRKPEALREAGSRLASLPLFLVESLSIGFDCVESLLRWYYSTPGGSPAIAIIDDTALLAEDSTLDRQGVLADLKGLAMANGLAVFAVLPSIKSVASSDPLSRPDRVLEFADNLVCLQYAGKGKQEQLLVAANLWGKKGWRGCRILGYDPENQRLLVIN